MKAEYLDHMGDDLTVVNAARVSFDKESEWQYDPSLTEESKTISEKDARLIAYLASHNHWTPFSHCVVTMRETVPIFVARQRFKHVVGFSYNEVSRRYVNDEPEFYVLDSWREKPEGSIKQGSSAKENTRKDWGVRYSRAVQEAYFCYKDMIENGVAPEQARMVLPQSMLTSYYVTGSLAAWARAYNQRSDPHAQLEIQQLAKQWDEIISPLFPHSWKALTK